MNIKLGDFVEITDGPFSGQQGIVERIYGDTKESFIRVFTPGGAVLVIRRLLKAVSLSSDDSLWGY